MDLEYSKKLLRILIHNSSQILNAGFGVDRAESSFFDVIDLLREVPHLREDFLLMVKDTLKNRDPSGLDEGSVPRELVELAAHELRWQEFRALANERVKSIFGGDVALARSDIAHTIAEAYQESWEGRQFYRRYNEHE
ncbi:hypothetical protein LB526_16790 [Mesorhizobium sp. CA6]|uniref:hypothetical protein n=1 Tax=Mesorhizobium sp. CA6 TaxID=588500 RepID=UPI001CCA1E81|nr:hypothetical protein [Mesorhizobium sp. CA6]MBZ9768414.1 hypothetical protein [Mesorhizobium sp. CA6]